MSINKSEPVVKNFMHVDRLHHTCVDEKVAAMGFGIHRNQHMLLMFLDLHGSMSQTEIAEHLGISSAAVANSLKSLEAVGYIERKADSADTRRNIVAITESGKKVIKKTKNAFDNIDEEMVKGLSEDDLETLRRCLETMEANLRRITENPEVRK